MTRRDAHERDVDREPRARAPRPGLLLCCVLVAILAAYIPVLGGPFVWDDHHLVEASPLVQKLQPLSDYFGKGFWQGDEVQPARAYYRPLSILSLAIDHEIYGDNSGGFHATNLIVHLLSTGLLFLLLRARAGPSASLLGSALWALYPRLTEAVAWISGRTDVLAGFFVLCALLARRRRGRFAPLVTAGCLFFGLLSKEVALAGVVAVIVSELVDDQTRRARWSRLLPTLLAFGAYLALRAHAIVGERHQTLTAFERVVAAFAALGHYFCMLLDPWSPDIQIGRIAHPGVVYVVLGGLVFLGSSWAFARKFKRLDAETAGALALSTVAIGLVLHLVPVAVNVLAADRFLYLPLAGLVLVLTPKLDQLERTKIVAVAAGALAASFAVTTFVRAGVWSDEVELWTTAFRETAEDRSLACVELGRLYAKSGLFDDALAIYRIGSNENYGGYAMSVHNGTTVLARMGRYQEAAERLARVTARYPDVPLFWLNLALFESYLGHFSAARADLSRALTLFPDYPQASTLAAQLPNLERQRRALEALPANTPALVRARLLGPLGLAKEAMVAWRAALLRPEVTQAEFEEGLTFAIREGSADDVEALYRDYRARFSATPNPKLEVIYGTRAELVARLRSAWPTLGISTASGTTD